VGGGVRRFRLKLIWVYIDALMAFWDIAWWLLRGVECTSKARLIQYI